jgi:hypothetical protein
VVEGRSCAISFDHLGWFAERKGSVDQFSVFLIKLEVSWPHAASLIPVGFRVHLTFNAGNTKASCMEHLVQRIIGPVVSVAESLSDRMENLQDNRLV